MSDVSTNAGAPSTGDVVRGNGNAPGQSLGEPMPDVPKGVERAGLSDFKRVLAERDAARRAGVQQPTARGKVAEFSQRLEARQQAPVQPNEPKPTKGENMGDPNQLKEPGNLEPPEGDPNQQAAPEGEEGAAEAEQQAESPVADPEKIAEWMNSDMFPEELESKWLHELKANGVVRYVDTAELKQGYIRGVDYRQFHAQAQAVTRQAEQQQASMRQHFEDVRDPAKMLEIYERQGYSDTLLGVARLIAERDRDDRAMINGAGYAAMQRYATNDPNDHRVVDAMKRCEERIKAQRATEVEGKRIAWEREQLQAQQRAQESQQKVQEHHAVYERQLNQLRPLVFRAFGIPDSKANRAELNRHIGAVLSTDGLPPEGLTRDLMMRAGRDMAESMDGNGSRPPAGLSPEQWQRVQARQRAQAGGQELSPQRMGGGGGKPMAGAGQERKRLSDLKAMVHANRMRGQ